MAVVVTALNLDASALEGASAALRDDEDVVGIAVQIDGLSLEWASARLRDDAAIVEAAVIQSGGGAVRFASADLQTDEVSLFRTVTFRANPSHNLTRSPSHIFSDFSGDGRAAR